MNTQLQIPFEVLYIFWHIQRKGYEVYLVGGAVRDLLINAVNNLQKEDARLTITDFDFTTNATPQQIQEIFDDTFYTNDFGMVGVAYQRLLAEMVARGFILPKDNLQSQIKQEKDQKSLINLAQASKIHHSLQQQVKQFQQQAKNHTQNSPPPFEITTYRSEGVYSDFRRPDQVNWGNSIEEDLKRRDFTINALALTIKQEFLESFFDQKEIKTSNVTINTQDYQLVDQHQGLIDLANQTIRTVGSPDERFQEDALRMLRAIRLACQLEFAIDPLTFAAIKHQAHLIKRISWERIKQEFLKMLSTSQPDRGIELLDDTGLLKPIMPELLATKNVEQGGHHDTDVWTHSLAAAKHCPSRDPIVRMAALLHDVGKPVTMKMRSGQITFYNHEIVSSRIADKIGKRLRLSNEQRHRLFELVRYHMFYYQPYHTDAAIRRLIKRVGFVNIDDLLDLREGDRLGSGARKTSWRLEELKERIVEQLNQPLAVTDLAINGKDLIGKLDVKPGPIIGKILETLLEKVLDNPDLNQQEKLIAEAQKILTKLND